MRAKPSGAVITGVVVGLLVYALAGYFLLVSPQKGKAADLKRQTDATQQQIDQYRTLAAQARATPPIRVAELFRLTKAMPDSVDMAGVILELSHVARASGIQFDSITPQGATPVSGYSTVPLTVEFDGNFYELSDFLFRVRNLVRVQAGVAGCAGTSFRRRRDQLRREHEGVPADQGEPDRPRLRLRRSLGGRPSGRSDRPGHDGHDVDGPDDRAHHDRHRHPKRRPRAQAQPRRLRNGEEIRPKGEGQEPEDHRGGARRAPPRRARVRGAVRLMKSMNKKPPAGQRRGAGSCPGSCSRGRRPRRRRPLSPCLSPRLFRFGPTGPGREWTAPVVRPILEQGSVCPAGGRHGA